MATKKNNKKQEKDTTLLDNIEKFAVENKDIPKLQQIITDYLVQNKGLRTRFAVIMEKIQHTKQENVNFFYASQIFNMLKQKELVNEFQKDNVEKLGEFSRLQENFESLKSQNVKKVSHFEVEKRNDLQS